ncbi:transmembrane protein 205-like, partial [Saccoglossus kowalevskii]|uniref:Transmembrane protein 205-like n=1 Tax=Saccoglossus kowalevskii TaxID=10224 RepID=A0ABM0M9G1_SACKO
LTMFHNLPRYWFSAVQSKLFPRYFLSGTLFSVITFVTFLSAHPFGSHDNMQTKIQVYSLIGVIVCTISNVFVTPVMIGYLNDRNKIEMKKGIDKNHIGHIDSSKFAGDLKYKDLSKKFLLYHGISSLLNLLAFCANVVYLYILSAGLTI